MREFPPFRLDTINQCLWRGDGAAQERVLLAPKAFDVLRYLVSRDPNQGSTPRARGVRRPVAGNILQGGAAGLGNAATRIENYMISRTAFVYGTYPEMEDLFVQQDRWG